MTFSGDLRDISLGDVFQNIASNRTTGTLRVQWRSSDRFVRFEEGMVAGFSLGPKKGLPILEHLVQRGYVDEAKTRRLLEKSKRSRKSPGQKLIEGRLIDADQLRDAFADLVAEHIYELVLQREARFDFSEGDPPPQVFGADQMRFRTPMDVGPLLVEGARRADEWERIHRVIGSDRDLFVALEGWEECDVDESALEIGGYLDGRTDVRSLLRELTASKFEIMKGIADLVVAGGARPSTTFEIEQCAREAIEAGDHEEAARLMRQALELERSNSDLRQEFADLLEQMDKPEDAAAEYALLGYQACRESDPDTALEHYDRAVQLNPEDPALQEQRIEILRRGQDLDALVAAVRSLADLWASMGLADRARELLLDTLRAADSTHPELLQQVAEIDARAGRVEDAAEAFLKLANRTEKTDEKAAADYLRLGLEHCPEHPELQRRQVEIQTGLRAVRERARRRLLAASAAAAVFLAFASTGLAELAASRGVVKALDRSLDSIQHGRPTEAIADLQSVQDNLGWTPSGHRAAVLVRRLVYMHLENAYQLAEAGDVARATAMLDELKDVVRGSPMQRDFDDVRGRVVPAAPK